MGYYTVSFNGQLSERVLEIETCRRSYVLKTVVKKAKNWTLIGDGCFKTPSVAKRSHANNIGMRKCSG